jgi:hypothetical protein
MSTISVQASFNAGEWAPTLYARVDQVKYKSGAALLENFFVDYRGGASSRPGTQYVAQAYKSDTPVRIITFQVSFNVGYVLEFGDGYIRFFYNGAAILENSFVVSGASQANPCVIQVAGNDFAIGDWIYVAGIVGMTELNNRFFYVANVVGNAVTLSDVNGNPINSSAYTAYSSGGTAAKVYTLASPYTASDDLRLIKFTQSIDQMILCHPNYEPYVLTIVAANDWTLAPISIGATVSPPAAPSISTTLAGGTINYAYGVTSIDRNGQESPMSEPGRLASKQDIRVVNGTNFINWVGVSSAVAYNIYKASVSYTDPVPVGVQYGFIGTVKGASFVDSNIGSDFTQTPPVAQNPFIGAGVDVVTVTSPGAYTTVPLVTFVGASVIPASGVVQLSVTATVLSGGGTAHAIGDIVSFSNGVQIQVSTIGGGGDILTYTLLNPGAISSGNTPTNPMAQASSTGSGIGASLSCTWGVSAVIVIVQGGGFSAPPTVTFSSGAAAATCTLTPSGVGNPTVPSFFQQRLVLAAPPGAPESFYLSKPGAYFNFDVSSPVRPDDSISGDIVSGVLNTIKSIVSSTAGMLILTDKASWLVNGGQSGAAVTPSAIVANAQSFIGANDVPPIVANYDILYVQSKGAGVRDLAYNIYYNVFTGTDISILSSHLFFGYEIVEWGWAEHPFYMVWCVRDDGVMLTLTFLKEQEFVGWSHHHTNGIFKSVTVATEVDDTIGATDGIYAVVEREINGNTVQYIERFAPRIFPNGLEDAWCVDCGLRYEGAATTTFTGGQHLAGQTCTGLADGVIIPEFVMPANGNFTLATPASKVIVGESFTCRLQTLALDIGEPTIQGKVKKINHVDVRVADTLGLDIGNDFDNLTPMKDLVLGEVNSMLTGQKNQLITGLFTGDARTYMSPAYTVPGQYCIQQAKPYPATILGVFPSYTVGDDP